MTLISGTLADLDLATIAATTSLGRSCLRLELRAASGAMIGSLVLKAGRIVSATAGGAHGHEALRVLMSSASDARFRIAHEPLDFALGSALASVDELAALQHSRPPRLPNGSEGMASPPRRLPTGASGRAAPVAAPAAGPATRGARLTVRPPSQIAPRTTRVEMMQGQLDEFDLLTLLQTIGLGRQLVEIEVRDPRGVTLGMVAVKSGKVVAARTGRISGVDAISELMRSPDSVQFAAFRILGDTGPGEELASVTEVSIRFAAIAPASGPRSFEPPEPALEPDFEPVSAPAPVYAPPPRPASPAGAPAARATSSSAGEVAVMEGSLADFDVRTIVETLAATRQHARLQILEPARPPLGEITLKAGWIMSVHAGVLHGREALAFLLGVSKQLRFRVVTGFATHDAEPLGSIRELLADSALPAALPPPAPSTRALRWAIPVSFLVGGLIVFLVVRGTSTPAAPAAPTAPAKSAVEPAKSTVEPPKPAEGPPPVDPAPAPAPAEPAAPPAQLPPVKPEVREAPADPAADDEAAAASTNQRIRNAQTALKRLGYDPGPIDNSYGRMTRQAIMDFQRKHRLRVTGVLDQQTWSALVGQLMP